MIRVGVIGCGWVAEKGHLPALARLPDVEVVALADPDPSRLKAFEGQLPHARRCADHRDLVTDPAVEAVAVCVPTRSHVEVATAAVEAGKHVLLEKPPAAGVEEWDRLSAAVEEAGVTLMVGLNMRWHNSFRALRNLVRQGEIGRVQCVRTILANDVLDRPDPPGWRSERQRGGGALMEMGTHHLDLCRFLLGEEIEEVLAVAEGDDDSLAVAARMQSGVPVSSLFSQRTAQVNEVEVYGDRGQVRASPHSPPRLLGVDEKPWTVGARLAELRAAISLPHAVRTRRLGGFYVSSFIEEWRHFLDAARSGGRVEVGVESGRRLLQAVLAVAASAHERRPVACVDAPPTLPPSSAPRPAPAG